MTNTSDPFLQQAIHQAVEIVSYQTDWPDRFEQEKSRLLTLSPAFIAIEHIGSTAVPGLAAKPIIDLLGAVGSMAIADELIPLLCRNGYVTSAEFNATLVDHRWLMRQERGHRTHHLHLVLSNGSIWKKRLLFRDALRDNPQIAKEYLVLKERLAGVHREDRERYTAAKTEFIERILANKL